MRSGALRVPARLALAGSVLLAVVACGTGGRGDGTLTVFAAASLTDAFGELAATFEADHADVDVQLDLAGSSSLREQILAGAPADVFASADEADMARLLDAGAVVDPVGFATNELEIVVPAGNPAGVSGLDAFGDTALLLGLCAAEVPCGAFARQSLDSAGVEPAVDTHEPDVRALLTKVEAGELDAAIVYASDVHAAGDAVTGIEIPEDHQVVARYPIAVVSGTGQTGAAEAFVALVRSPRGRRILERFGFGPP